MAVRLSPARRRSVRRMWVARSRSPRLNHPASPYRCNMARASKGVAANAPAALFVDQPGQRVGDDVNVGADVQAKAFQIIAGVADDGERFGVHDVHQAAQKFGGSDAACQRNDHPRPRPCRSRHPSPGLPMGGYSKCCHTPSQGRLTRRRAGGTMTLRAPEDRRRHHPTEARRHPNGHPYRRAALRHS